MKMCFRNTNQGFFGNDANLDDILLFSKVAYLQLYSF